MKALISIIIVAVSASSAFAENNGPNILNITEEESYRYSYCQTLFKAENYSDNFMEWMKIDSYLILGRDVWHHGEHLGSIEMAFVKGGNGAEGKVIFGKFPKEEQNKCIAFGKSIAARKYDLIQLQN